MAKSPFWADKLRSCGTVKKFSREEMAQHECDEYNSAPGELDGVDCLLCKNKGFIAFVDDWNYVSTKECGCMAKRRNIWRIQHSGLSGLLEQCTFESFIASEPWQKNILEKAKAYANNPEGWFYIGGQVGAGKTHICTAITGALMDKGLSARYMLWQDEARNLKANTMDDEVYNKRMDELKICDVLYIDDFFKIKNSPKDKNEIVTNADIKVAFELLNYRYINRMTTIISSEWPAQSLADVDEAVGSRIIQMSGQYNIKLGRDAARNYRLRRPK